MGRLTAFVSDTAIALIEQGALPESGLLDLGLPVQTQSWVGGLVRPVRGVAPMRPRQGFFSRLLAPRW